VLFFVHRQLALHESLPDAREGLQKQCRLRTVVLLNAALHLLLLPSEHISLVNEVDEHKFLLVPVLSKALNILAIYAHFTAFEIDHQHVATRLLVVER
jgi:hypothetical protein